MAILYTHNRSSRKKPSAKVLRLREERKVYFSAILKDRPRKERTLNIPERIVKDLPPLSNSVGNGFKRSVEDYKWKRDREESAATVKDIEEKKKRLAPVYSKGPVQYLTEGTDPVTLGKKV